MTWDGTERRKDEERRNDPNAELERFKIYERFKKQDGRIIEIAAQNESIFKKLDQLFLVRADDAKEIQRIRSAVENGLSRDLKSTIVSVDKLNETIQSMCSGFNERLEKVEEFAWFRDWITDLRDGAFKKAIKFAVVVVILFVGIVGGIVYFGYEFMKGKL